MLLNNHLSPVCQPSPGVHQHDAQHAGQQLREERSRIRPRRLEHRGLLQPHQRLSVPRPPGQRYDGVLRDVTHYQLLQRL